MTTSYGEPITLIKIYQVSSILHAGSIAIHRTLSRHYSVSSTSNNACPIPAVTNGTDLDMSSDTNTQEQEIFNTAILTYATEDQTGRKSAPIHVPSKPVQCQESRNPHCRLLAKPTEEQTTYTHLVP